MSHSAPLQHPSDAVKPRPAPVPEPLHRQHAVLPPLVDQHIARLRFDNGTVRVGVVAPAAVTGLLRPDEGDEEGEVTDGDDWTPMNPKRITIIPFIHGKFTRDGRMSEPDIYWIMEKWLEPPPGTQAQDARHPG